MSPKWPYQDAMLMSPDHTAFLALVNICKSQYQLPSTPPHFLNQAIPNTLLLEITFKIFFKLYLTSKEILEPHRSEVFCL